MEHDIITPEELKTLLKTAQANAKAANLEPVQDRVTLTLNVHHQQPNDQPYSVEAFASYFCKSKEQAYNRRKTATEKWELIYLGWVKPDEVGMILIQNLEGIGLTKNPTAEEEAEIDKHVLEIGSVIESNLSLLVAPGWPQQFTPSITSLSIRSLHGKTSYKVSIFPK